MANHDAGLRGPRFFRRAWIDRGAARPWMMPSSGRRLAARLILLAVISTLLAATGCTRWLPGGGGDIRPPAMRAATPKPGLGAIRGRVANVDIYGERKLYVYAAEYYEQQGSGMFLLEPTLFPHAQVDREGNFLLNDMPPKTYVLLIGSTPESATILQTAEGPAIFQVIPGEILAGGDLYAAP